MLLLLLYRENQVSRGNYSNLLIGLTIGTQVNICILWVACGFHSENGKKYIHAEMLPTGDSCEKMLLWVNMLCRECMRTNQSSSKLAGYIIIWDHHICTLLLPEISLHSM